MYGRAAEQRIEKSEKRRADPGITIYGKSPMPLASGDQVEYISQRQNEEDRAGEVVIFKGCAPDENPWQKLRKITDDDKFRSSVPML